MGESAVQAVKYDLQAPRRSIDYCTANQTQPQGSVERMGECHRMHGKSCLVYSTRWIECVAPEPYPPHHFEPYSV